MRRGLSLGLKLPLYLAGLMAVVVGLQIWGGYRTQVRSQRRAAGVRLNQVATELIQSLTVTGEDVRSQLAVQAKSRALEAYLAADAAQRPALARAALAELKAAASPALTIAMELWDGTGHVLLGVDSAGALHDAARDAALARAASRVGGPVTGRMREAGDVSGYPTAAPVVRDGRTVGFVVTWRRLISSSAAERQVGQLVGTGGRIFVGNAADSVWSNLYTRANPPPPALDTTGAVMQYRRRAGEMLAVARRVPSTPWDVVVEFPVDSVLAPVRGDLRQMFELDALVLVLGVGAAWGLSRRLVGRLRHLTASVARLAGGSPEGPSIGGDEIARLRDAFTAMGHRVEDALAATAKSELQYRQLFEANPLPTFVVDLQSLRFLNANNAALDHYGYTRDELLGMTLRDIRPADDVSRMEADVAELGTLPEPRGAWRHLKKDGTPIEVEVIAHRLSFEGRPAAMTVVTDVTERNRQQRAARQSEARYRALIHEAPYGIALSTLQGIFTDVNPALVHMLGYDRAEELIGTSVVEVYVDHDVRRGITAELGSRGHARREALHWRRRDGQVITARLTARIVPASDTTDAYVEAIIEDVTEKLRLEEQFHQAQRMEAIGRLAGGIAHDFNNLLTVVMTTTELLLAGHEDPERTRAELHDIYRSAQRGAELTRQLLAFSRRQVLSMEPLSVSALVRDLESLLRRLLGEDVQLSVESAPDHDVVRADPGQLEQVLMNLAVNARDAMPDGGRLLIETEPVEIVEGEQLAPIPMKPGPYVRVVVSDTGTGMARDVMEHIFEPFFTTKSKEKGTGLGLATVYGIVKQLDGYVWAYSEVGKGTSFKIYLPRVPDAPRRTPPRGSVVEEAPTHHTVLIAEDEPAIRMLLERVLKNHEYHVIATASGEDALRAAIEHGDPIHLLVTDVVMAGMTGPQLAARLAEVHPETIPLFLSGYTDEAVVKLGVAAGEVAFLQKPFTHTEFLAKVRETLAKPR